MLIERIEDEAFGFSVHLACGLVEKEQRRRAGHRDRKCGPGALAAGKLIGIKFPALTQTPTVKPQECRRQPVAIVARQGRNRQPDIAFNRQVRDQVGALKYHTDFRGSKPHAFTFRRSADLPATAQYASSIGIVEPGQA